MYICTVSPFRALHSWRPAELNENNQEEVSVFTSMTVGVRTFAFLIDNAPKTVNCLHCHFGRSTCHGNSTKCLSQLRISHQMLMNVKLLTVFMRRSTRQSKTHLTHSRLSLATSTTVISNSGFHIMNNVYTSPQGKIRL